MTRITPDMAEEITPEQATLWLEKNNEHNRDISEAIARRYAAQVSAGEWRVNGRTLSFDTDDQIVDGQHFLRAIEIAGVPASIFVVEGLEPDVRPTVDGGLARKSKDDLQILYGITDPHHKAAILAGAVLWNRQRGLATLGGQNSMRPQLAELWKEYAKSIEDAAPAKNLVRGVPFTTGAASLFWWIVRRNGSDPELIEQFFSIFRDGTQDPYEKVIYRLRRFLDTPHQHPRTHRPMKPGKKHEIYWAILAWNGWLQHDEEVSFKIPREGISNPYPKPVRAKLDATARKGKGK